MNSKEDSYVGVVQGIGELDNPASSRSDLRGEEMAAVVVVLWSNGKNMGFRELET